MEDILIGTVDRTILVFIADSAQTDGSGKTGLVAANLECSYTRVETDNDVVMTDVTSSLNNLSALTDAHNDWGLLEVSSTLAPGLYRLDIADAVFATGAWYAVVYVQVASSDAAPSPKQFNLVAYNKLDGVRLGLTALPNAAADAAGGLPISDAGGLDLDAKIGALTYTVAGDVDVNVQSWAGASVAAVHTAGYPVVTIKDGTGTGEINTNAGAVALVDLVTTTTTATTATNVTTVNGLAAGVITAASIATGAIDADALAADAVDEIWDEVVVNTLTARVALGLAASGGLGTFSVNDAGATTTVFITDLTSAVNDFYRDMQLTFTSGVLAGQIRVISAYTGATKTVTLDEATTSAPANGVTFVVSGPHTHTVSSIADGVWDEATSGHTTSGTFGEQCKTDIDAILDDTGTAGVVVASLAANSITASVIAAGAIDAATFAADVDAEILSYIVDDATRIDASALNTASVTSVPAILVDTNELQTDWTNGGRLDLLIDAILDDTSTAGVPLTAAAVDAILDEVVEGSYTVRQYLRGFASALLAKVSGLPTAPIFRNTADSGNRITATTDSDGNRSAVTLDLS